MTLPTSINNKLKVITNMIYLKYGEENKMQFNGFKKWIHQHIKFLDKINFWFRTSLWQNFYDKNIERNVLNFHRTEADL